MKITSFNPMIVTKDPEATIALFEALGFERHHYKVNEEGLAFSSVRMKHENGFYVDVVASDKQQTDRDLTLIRMNVDDFEEAAELLLRNGFHESKIVSQSTTATSRYAYFVSPSGFMIDLIKHIKKDG